MWEAIRTHYGLKRNHDFAVFFGVSDQTANGWMKTGVLNCEEVYRRCPDISPDWLLSQGSVEPMLRTASQSIQGDNNTQVGGDLMRESGETAKEILELLRVEQANCAKQLEQNSALISIITNLTTK